MALLKVHLLKAVNVDYNFCQDSVLILSSYFLNSIMQVSCSLKEHVVYKLPYPTRNFCEIRNVNQNSWKVKKMERGEK